MLKSTVWVEINHIDYDYYKKCDKDHLVWGGPNVSHIEYVKNGVRGFAYYGMSDIWLTSSTLSQARLLYEESGVTDLCRRLNVTLTGGLKFRAFLSDMEDADGWYAMRTAAEQVAMMTNNRHVIIDSETALSEWHSGEREFDLAKVRKASQALNGSPVEFIWYLPTIMKLTRSYEEQAEMVKIFDRHGSTFLTSRGTGRPSYLNDGRHVIDLASMKSLVGDRLMYFYYMEPANTDAWSVMAASHHAKRIGVEPIFYPGLCGWGKKAFEAFVEKISRR